MYLKAERGASPHTVQAYQRDLSRFLTFSRPLKRVRPTDISNFLGWLKRRGLSARSAARALSAVRHYHRFLMAEGVSAEDPTEQVEGPNLWKRLPHVLSREEITSLFQQTVARTPLAVRDRAALELLYASGLRISELTGLTMDRVNLEGGELAVIGKGSKERLVPFGKEAARWLARYLREARPVLVKGRPAVPEVFVNHRGGRCSRVGMWGVVKRELRKVGLGGKASPHTFRHSFATHLLQGGADLRSVQALLGHAKIATTEIYTHVDRDYLRKIHRQFHPRA